jgi:glycosyltransferase involved in cell wall biosynthesis
MWRQYNLLLRNHSVRVLHIQKVTGIAGSENHLLTLLPSLPDYGYEPTMLVLADRSGRSDPFVAHMQAVGVPTEVIPMRGDLDPLLLHRLVHFIRQGGHHIVHTHLLHADLYGRLAARIAGRKVISTYHCDDPFHLIWGVKQVDRITALMCSQIICISKAVQEFVHKQIGVAVKRLNVVHYGLKPPPLNNSLVNIRANLSIGSADSLVGIVARLTEQKGHSHLLHAIQLLLNSIPSIHLAIVGDGELRSQLEDLSIQLGIKEHVHFLGFRSDVLNLMCEFDILVVPSLFEGFGLVLLEAMAAAKPIVATRVSAIPEIIVDGKTGLLVPPCDPRGLAQAILQLIMNPGLALNLGYCGRKQLEQRFTVQKMVEDTVRVYRTVVPSGN